MELKNTFCSVEYREDEKMIFAQDLVDTYNLPAMFTQSKRGLKKAWEEIKTTWTPQMTLSGVINILRNKGIKTHYWCRMD